MVVRDKPHAKYPHGYAIVRIDRVVAENQLEDSVTVVKVFSSKMAAEKDAARLNGINAEKGCRYFVYVTRMITDE